MWVWGAGWGPGYWTAYQVTAKWISRAGPSVCVISPES